MIRFVFEIRGTGGGSIDGVKHSAVVTTLCYVCSVSALFDSAAEQNQQIAMVLLQQINHIRHHYLR
jgi:hypothetical protein